MARTAIKQPAPGGEGFARTMKVLGGAFVSVPADTVLNAQSIIAIVPAGFVLQSISGTIPKLDNGAGLVLNIGDALSGNRLVSASTVGQAGGAVPALPGGAVGYAYPADTPIIMTATTGAATPITASIAGTFYLQGYMGP
jgi:hypothetical protein